MNRAQRWSGLPAQVAKFFAPLALMGLVYDAQRYWAATARGPVRVGELRNWELAWFGISAGGVRETPAEWCQHHLHAWLDLVCGGAYISFLPVFLALAAWWRFREGRAAAQQMMWAMMWLNLAAYALYLVYPAAPPWYVAHYGLGPVQFDAAPETGGGGRFDALLGVHWFAGFYSHSTNIFGAMPSLHVGQTFLAALYSWRFRSLRVLATGFWAVVAIASVYLNHHYIVDGLAGMALTLAVLGAIWAFRLARASRSRGLQNRGVFV